MLLGTCSITTDNLKIGDGLHEHLSLINGIKSIGKIEISSNFKASRTFTDEENTGIKSMKNLIFDPLASNTDGMQTIDIPIPTIEDHLISSLPKSYKNF